MTSTPVSDIVFTPAVKAVQERLGSREAYDKIERGEGWRQSITPDLAAFIAQRDSFFLATASAAGQPTIQHRGGPKGFLKVVGDRAIAIADFRGNRQYITIGNLSENERFSIFLIDYPSRQRIKIWGRARVVEDDPSLLEQVSVPGYRAKPERVLLFEIDAWDINCPQHITPRYTEAEIAQAVSGLQARIVELEQELAALRPQSGI